MLLKEELIHSNFVFFSMQIEVLDLYQLLSVSLFSCHRVSCGKNFYHYDDGDASDYDDDDDAIIGSFVIIWSSCIHVSFDL